MYRRSGKRLFDLIFTILAVIILLPLFAVLTMAFCFIHKGNPLFIQKRVGKNERIFRIVKFKTMSDTVNANHFLLPDRQRTSAFGEFCRKTSLDELPQLWNILKGDMSLVGPRPLLVEYLPKYNESQKKRHQIKPGLSGWVQVNGRNQIPWSEKFLLDNWYVDNLSFVLDLKIICMTIQQMVYFNHISFPDSNKPNFTE
jgi:lipopolysaccharide/colanic/teichoic acid biosynthesis glycosyltransferase